MRLKRYEIVGFFGKKLGFLSESGIFPTSFKVSNLLKVSTNDFNSQKCVFSTKIELFGQNSGNKFKKFESLLKKEYASEKNAFSLLKSIFITVGKVKARKTCLKQPVVLLTYSYSKKNESFLSNAMGLYKHS